MNISKAFLYLIIAMVIILLIAVLVKNNKKSSSQSSTLLTLTPLLCPSIFDAPSIVPVPLSIDMEDQDYNANIALQLAYFHELLYHLFCNNLLLSISTESSLLNTLNKYMSNPFQVVKVLYSTSPTPISNKSEVAGFIGTLNRNNIIYTFVIFRATCTSSEYYNDAKINLVTPSWAQKSSIKVHNGFNIIYTSSGKFPSLREQVLSYINSKNVSNLIISGHSLGGCLSGLLLCDLIVQNKNIINNTKTYLFAAPYTGNNAFAETIKNKTIVNSKYKLYNLINNQDKAPTLKLGSEYARLSPQTFCFSKTSDISNHLVKLYRDAIIENKILWESCKLPQCGIACL